MNMKLLRIFALLEVGDVITTTAGEFVVCRKINFGKGPYAEDWRYAIGKICGCNTHCDGVLPYSFAWNEERDAFCDANGEPLAGWSETVTLERDIYAGRDKPYLEFVLVIDELPPMFDDNDEKRRGELAVLARTLRDVVRLAPDERTTWHSVMAVLGVRLSEAQMLALSGAFSPAEDLGKVLTVAILGAGMAEGILKSKES